MPAQRILLQSSAAQTASSNGGSHELGTATMGVVYVQVTAVSGTTPGMSVWLEGSPDNGTTFFPLPHAQQLVCAAIAAHTDVTAATNKLFITAADLGAAGKWMAIYPYLPFKTVRLAWFIDGTTPSFTFYATMDVK